MASGFLLGLGHRTKSRDDAGASLDTGRMSAMTAAGIILAAMSAVTIVIVLWMFWWAAREDGREQKRTDARLRGR